jgi:glycogen debranching enzyme
LEKLLQTFDSPDFAGNPKLRWPLPPSTGSSERSFDSRSYWRGPVWPVVNWLLWWSLVRGGDVVRAAQIRRASLDQIAQGGFAEYFDPFSGTPLGSIEQSWTAAVTLDWLVANKLQSVNMDAA